MHPGSFQAAATNNVMLCYGLMFTGRNDGLIEARTVIDIGRCVALKIGGFYAFNNMHIIGRRED